MYIGIDIGSVSTDFVVLDEENHVLEQLYLSTKGTPIRAVQEGLRILSEKYSDHQILGVGTTGSGRKMIAAIVGADSIKNEITTHATAAIALYPEVRTILEIGGQDSKIILIQNGILSDFAMNTVCAAGTGSFLDRQAGRLSIPIEEFGDYALQAPMSVRIAGRCAVFAESDMIHKQQMGYDTSVIIKGLCDALVRNYLNNIAKGKKLQSPILFQGGVAANLGMKKSFEEALGMEVIVPQYHKVMGAIGAAILAKEAVQKTHTTRFKGFSKNSEQLKTQGFECTGCSNYCEVLKIQEKDQILGYYGDRCGKWSDTAKSS